MIISLIAAVAENRVIGKDNKLVWDLPRDMKFFMDTTSGHHIITGRRNYESIPDKFRPLKNRINIVVTHQKDYKANGTVVVHSLEDAFMLAKNAGEAEAFVIGGGQIYQQSISSADRLYITEVKAEFEGDTYFPKFNKESWQEISRKPNLPDDRHAYAYDFVVLERKR